MKDDGDLRREIEALRERLSRLSEASLRINESLDLDSVLQGVLDSARTLTGARYALITTLDGSGQAEEFLVSGLTPDEARQLWELPTGQQFFQYLSGLPGPLRVRDFAGHVRSMGLPDFHPPVPVSSFLAAPLRHQGASVGNINVARSEPGQEFTREDEETLVMFASQAALVIANARRHRDELRARSGLETLIDTSPVGVVVFALSTGTPVSFIRRANCTWSSVRDRRRPRVLPRALAAAKPSLVRRRPTSRSWSATHAAMLTIWCPTKAMGSSGSSSRNCVHPSVSSRDLIFTPRARRAMMH